MGPVMVALADCAFVSMILSMKAAVAMASDVPSATSTVEAILAPAVAIAPACPWTHAEEDPIMEVARPIVPNRGAAVR